MTVGDSIISEDKGLQVVEFSTNTRYYYKWGVISILGGFAGNYYLMRHNDLHFDLTTIVFAFFPTILFTILGLSFFYKAWRATKIIFNLESKVILFPKGKKIPIAQVLLLNTTQLISKSNNRNSYSFQLNIVFLSGGEYTLLRSDSQYEIREAGQYLAKKLKVLLELDFENA